MIDKKQLMIGNQVVVAHESNIPIVTIKALGAYGAYIEESHMNISYDLLMPIELNGHWLEKCGFEEQWIGRWQHPKGIDIEKVNDSGYMLLCEERSNWSKHYCFVHEIQNVFYWLTGEELTIKTN